MGAYVKLIRMVINSSIAALRHGVPPLHRYDSSDYRSNRHYQ
jgi:methylglutaconyl-CoA hydratase